MSPERATGTRWKLYELTVDCSCQDQRREPWDSDLLPSKLPWILLAVIWLVHGLLFTWQLVDDWLWKLAEWEALAVRCHWDDGLWLPWSMGSSGNYPNYVTTFTFFAHRFSGDLQVQWGRNIECCYKERETDRSITFLHLMLNLVEQMTQSSGSADCRSTLSTLAAWFA